MTEKTAGPAFGNVPEAQLASKEVVACADYFKPVPGRVHLERFDSLGAADHLIADGFARFANVVLEPAW